MDCICYNPNINYTIFHKRGSKQMNTDIMAYCGLYCGGCKFYQNTVKGIKTFDNDKFVTCKGCASDTTTPWCTDCAIKVCCKEKGLRVCIDCKEYPCEKINGFVNDSNFPYHLEVPDSLKRLKAIGEEDWMAEKELRYTCSNCNSKFNWNDHVCEHCGAKVK